MKTMLGLLALFAGEVSSSAEPPEEVRHSSVGEVDVLELGFAPSPRLQVGANGVLEVRAGGDPRQLQVLMLKKGTSSVLVYKEDGTLGLKLLYSVGENSLSATVLKVRRLLQSVEGITVHAMGDQVVVDGEVLTLADKDRVHKVASAYPGVLDLTTLSKLGR